MLRSTLFLLLLVILPQQDPVRTSASDADSPTYAPDGGLNMPEHYREWVFLTSGLDMSYSQNAAMAGQSMFDNVFVNPTSYRAFQATGTWPDRTILVLEARGAEGASSINKRGHTQSSEIMGTEIHVKDARLDGGWGFFDYDGKGPAKPIKRPASCYQCHENHAAVDTTFVQFYPTLLATARSQKTLSPAYLKEIADSSSAK